MRVGLCFSEPLMGEATACLLESRRPWSVGFIASSVHETFDSLSETPVGVLLVEGRGLGSEEIRCLASLREEDGPAVVLLADESHPALPVDRVVPRRASTDEVLTALDELVRTSARPRMHPLPYDLTRREHECAQLVSRGMSNRRIAEMTGLREQSVKNVVSLAMRKLGVDNRVQIALRIGGTSAAPAQTLVTLSMPPAPEPVGTASE